MAGGFFSGGSTPQQPLQQEQNVGSTAESSPGGFFDGGASANITNSTAASAADAANFARIARGWAVGSSTGNLTDFSDTNNALYWSSQASTRATEALASRNAAAASASAASASETAAESARDLALGYRNEASGFRNEAQGFARSADSDAAAALADRIRAEAAAVETDSDAAATQADADRAFADAERAEAARISAEADAASTQADSEGVAADLLVVEARAAAAATSATNAATSATNAARSAQAADSEAIIAKNWAVGPSGVGTGTDTNNAMYWALQARAANDVDIVQLELNAGDPTPAGIRFSGNYDVIYLDSEQYHVQEPIVTYNGVVLTEGDHYTVDSDGSEIAFDSAVEVSTGDCITVTGASENSSPDILPTLVPTNPQTGQMYFDVTNNRIRIWNGSAWRNIVTTA